MAYIYGSGQPYVCLNARVCLYACVYVHMLHYLRLMCVRKDVNLFEAGGYVYHLMPCSGIYPYFYADFYVGFYTGFTLISTQAW
jgi:hypothetical protein